MAEISHIRSHLASNRLPPELIGVIAGHFPTIDLYAMSAVSRTFSAEAEPLLYHSVSFEWLEPFATFAATVHTNPRKARRTKSLRLSARLLKRHSEYRHDPKGVTLDAGYHVARRAQALVNLKELTMTPRPTQAWDPSSIFGIKLYLGGPVGSPFRLQKLRIVCPFLEILSTRDATFLREQAKVEDFQAVHFNSSLDHDLEAPFRAPSAGLFPDAHTADLTCTCWLERLDGRNIRRLALRMLSAQDFAENSRHACHMPLEHLCLSSTMK